MGMNQRPAFLSRGRGVIFLQCVKSDSGDGFCGSIVKRQIKNPTEPLFRKMKKILLAMSLAAVASVPAAASAADLTAAPDAEITLSTTVTRTVPNDEAVLTLAVTRQGATAKDAQKAMLTVLNQGMKALRAALPAGKAVLQSGSLYTNPNYSQAKKGEGVKILNWTSREEVRVTLKDPSLAGEAIDAANRYFEFSGLQFRVSRDASLRNRSDLMADAMADLGAKAAVVAKAFGIPASGVKVYKLSFGGQTGNYYPQAPMLMAVRKAAPAADSVEMSPGESDVSLSASAVFKIK